MAIKIDGYRSSPPFRHQNREGGLCGSEFEFKDRKGLSLAGFAERSCRCGRVESYDPHKILLVAKSGVAEESLREFCLAVIKKAAPLRGEKTVELFPQLEILRDASNPQRIAAVIIIHNIGTDTDPQNLLELVAKRARETMTPAPPRFEETVEWVFRKPIAYFELPDGSRKFVDDN